MGVLTVKIIKALILCCFTHMGKVKITNPANGKSVVVEIGGQQIDKHYSDWLYKNVYV